MNLLSFIPTGWLWPAIGIAGLALASVVGVQTMRLDHAHLAIAELQAAWSKDRQQAAEATAREESANRAKEQKWIKDQKERDDANDLKLQGLRADAAIADAASGRLLQRVAALAAAARQAATGAPAVESGPPATDSTGMFADVFSQCIERVRRLAAIADERGAAGSLCASEYDSLTAP